MIAPAIRSGKRVCVCGHENNLRSLLKYIDGISNAVRLNQECFAKFFCAELVSCKLACVA